MADPVGDERRRRAVVASDRRDEEDDDEEDKEDPRDLSPPHRFEDPIARYSAASAATGSWPTARNAFSTASITSSSTRTRA